MRCARILAKYIGKCKDSTEIGGGTYEGKLQLTETTEDLDEWCTDEYRVLVHEMYSGASPYGK